MESSKETDSLETIQNNRYLDINVTDDPSLKLCLRMVELLQDAKAEEIILLDIKNYSSLSDYIIICEGRSQTHSRGIAENTEFMLKKEGEISLGLEGGQEGNWVLLDYGNIIIHVFHPEIRKYYELEKLFAYCPYRNFSEEMDESLAVS